MSLKSSKQSGAIFWKQGIIVGKNDTPVALSSFGRWKILTKKRICQKVLIQHPSVLLSASGPRILRWEAKKKKATRIRFNQQAVHVQLLIRFVGGWVGGWVSGWVGGIIRFYLLQRIFHGEWQKFRQCLLKTECKVTIWSVTPTSKC